MAQTTTQTSSIPSYIQQPTQSALSSIQSFLKSSTNRPYGSKTGESLYTPLSTSQNEAIGNINWLSDQNLSSLLGIDKAGSMLEGASGRIVDENGAFGAIGDYMNPYLQNVLDPQIRELEESLQRGRRDLGANATMSGAFGDARHGVMEKGLYDTTQQNISDVTGKAYADAWNNAMGLRQGDREAMQTGASGISQLGQNYLKNFLDVNDALFNAGQVEHDQAETQRQAQEDFVNAVKDKKYNDALKLLGAVRGSPYTTSSTSSQKSDDGMWGILGSVLGGILG